MEENEELAILMRGLRGQNLRDSQFAEDNVQLRLVEVYVHALYPLIDVRIRLCDALCSVLLVSGGALMKCIPASVIIIQVSCERVNLVLLR
jgi:hypothetical protein